MRLNIKSLLTKIAKITGAEYIAGTPPPSNSQPQRKLKVYCGYQVSAALHVGHLAGIKILNTLAQFDDLDVSVLAADLHMWMNKKKFPTPAMYQGLYASFKKYLHPKIRVITGAFGNHTGVDDNFQMRAEYFKRVIEFCNSITLSRASRSMTADLKSNSNSTINCSNVLYPVLQITDMAHLGINIAIGGMDQRKIHMLARDSFKKVGLLKPHILHTPLLLNNGVKLSKSMGNGLSLGDTRDI